VDDMNGSDRINEILQDILDCKPRQDTTQKAVYLARDYDELWYFDNVGHVPDGGMKFVCNLQDAIKKSLGG
jgi:hypothetical protein